MGNDNFLVFLRKLDTPQLVRLADSLRDLFCETADYESAAKARDLFIRLRDRKLADEQLEDQWSIPSRTPPGAAQ